MKHLEIKNSIAGSKGKGGGSKPKPPVLKPPRIGDYSVAASFSYSESVDLISDGPIEGLVNSNGYTLTPASYMQGLYLNDTQVEVTNENFVTRFDEEIEPLDPVEAGALECFSDSISGVYQKLENREDVLYDFTSYIHETIKTRKKVGRSYRTETSVSTKKYQNPLKQKSNKILISQLPNPRLFSNSKQESKAAENQYACIDISEDNGYSGVAVRYSENEVLTVDEAIDKYAFVSSTSRYDAYVGGIFGGSRSSYEYWKRRYGTTSAYNKYIKPIADKIKKKNIACGGTFFFEKTCEDINNEPTLYSEICLQPFKLSDALNQNKPEGIYRKKIDEAITQLIDEVNVDKTRGAGLSSEYLRLTLDNLGISTNINQEDGSISPITKEQISSFIKGALDKEADTQGSVIEEYSFPYSFVSYDSNKVLEGYNQNDHEELFRAPNFIENIEPSTAYYIGESIHFASKYYTVLVDFTSQPGDITETYITTLVNALTIVEEEPPIKNVEDGFSIEPKSSAPRGEYLGQRINLFIPNLDSNGLWDGRVKGFYMEILNAENVRSVVTLPTRRKTGKSRLFARAYSKGVDKSKSTVYWGFLVDKEEVNYNKNIEGLAIFDISLRNYDLVGSGRKYNYSNVMMEFRNGEQNQTPLSYFRNIFIDHFYNSQLIGPFNVKGERIGLGANSYDYRGIQKLKESNNLKKINGVTPDLNFNDDSIPPMSDDFTLAQKEGSSDFRNAQGQGGGNKSYHKWNKSKIDYNERAQPITHVIANPNTKSCFITISVEALLDTAEDTYYDGGELGSRIPAPVNIMIETGLVDNLGRESVFVRKFFQIVALVETPNYMDIGNPDSRDSLLEYKDVREVDRDVDTVAQGGVDKPFLLPDIPYSEVSEDTEHNEDKKDRRYIRVTKLSTESNSTLIKKDISLIKVTEIIDSQCTYPFSAIVGTKVDSRVFSDIPKRTYRGKFKKIRIPSNYEPTFSNGKDKRLYETVSEYENASKNSKAIYRGDWDGSFKFAWSDNPAWILYDMLLSDRYGLGQQVSEEEVDKWQLYSIGRFCDSVDEDGYFVGSPDGRGGLEPRFNCNIAFSEGTKIFDAVNSIAAIFRGMVYFHNSAISFSDDRLKKPIGLFTNSNVKDGNFSYSSYKRDEKFNAVEISYKDKNDDFKNKVEYVENEKDIIERGIFKKEITAAGVTSKAMAIRAAKHIMYQTTKENETVTFDAGNEVLLCKPGDLIIVEDELKTLRNNIGRILSVDPEEGSLRTTEPFNVSENIKEITVYVPTGNTTKAELDYQASLKRKRVTEFKIEVDPTYPDFKSKFESIYRFDKYERGFNIEKIEDEIESELYEEYALYTGINNQFIWFDTEVTGWVFSTGKALIRDNEYNMYITSTGSDTFNFKSLSNGVAESVSGFVYDTNSINSRSGVPQINLSGVFNTVDDSFDLDYQGGVENEKININGNPQIRTFTVTGWGGYKGQQSESFGDKIYIDKNDINANLIKFIPEGSTYRFQSKDFTDQVFKITNIKESENYSYNVVATKYHSGKYLEIENSIYTEKEEELFDYANKDFKINDINYITLSDPEVELTNSEEIEDGETFYYLDAEWESVENATGYYYYFETPNGSVTEAQITKNNSTRIEPEFVGRHGFKIQALADVFNNESYNKRFFDSNGASFSITVENVREEDDTNEGVTTSEITAE